MGYIYRVETLKSIKRWSLIKRPINLINNEKNIFNYYNNNH